jgi:hypothetical protein
LEFFDPSLLTGGVLKGADRGHLVLFEFLHSHGFPVELHVENSAVTVDQVAFLSDLHHGANDLVLDEQGVEAEV